MTAIAATQRVSYAELARLTLRDQVLDAVGELLRDRPWAQVTMAEIADRAGLSRQTLYNAFGSRAELAQAYVDREADRFLVAIEGAVREHAAEPRQALAAALALFLTAAREHPAVRAVTGADGSDELLPLITTRGGPLVERVTERLAELFLATWPQLRRADAAPVADVLVRLAISHAALPSGDPGDTAQAIARLLGPRIDQLVG